MGSKTKCLKSLNRENVLYTVAYKSLLSEQFTLEASLCVVCNFYYHANKLR